VSTVAENLELVRGRIADAAERCGRSPGDIDLVAVSKTVAPEFIATAIAAGQTVFGENRVQEAEAKIPLLADRPGAEWHLIGHLQSNKARKAVELFKVIHSVDSEKLARRLSEAAAALGRTVSVLVQVDLGEEETKFGAPRCDAMRLVEALGSMPGLRLDGLMTIPPYFEDPERARPYFRELREILERLESVHPGIFGRRHLSMGMSHDFEVAIEEGATLVRVGTAIFGERARD
jgi:PLP dependent protein